MKIGILDWGIGGVDFLKRLNSFSSIDTIYFSDSGFTPYGKVPAFELKGRVENAIHFLRGHGCDFIVVACNAASTVLPNDSTVIGVLNAGIGAVLDKKITSLGVVGGKRTIESNIFKNGLEEKGIKVHQQIAQPLSARVEAGDLESVELKKEIEEIFSHLKGESHILLACTHYINLSAKIKEYLPQVNLIDPIDFLIEEKKDIFKDKTGTGEIEWLTTGDPVQMKEVIEKLYKLEVDSIKKVEL